ncbi:MAG: hypothetical protein Aureis2KO_01220 [Aureisphaera sp.]
MESNMAHNNVNPWFTPARVQTVTVPGPINAAATNVPGPIFENSFFIIMFVFDINVRQVNEVSMVKAKAKGSN